MRRCSLLRRATGRAPAAELVPAGALDPEMLAREGSADPARALRLRFVAEPLRGGDYRRWQARDGRPVFKTAGRLARVGLFSRLIDSL